jgi:hypothetical protein
MDQIKGAHSGEDCLVEIAVGQRRDTVSGAGCNRRQAFCCVLMGLVAAQVAGVLGILVEVDQGVE